MEIVEEEHGGLPLAARLHLPPDPGEEPALPSAWIGLGRGPGRDASAYPSPSEADFALACRLAFWCGRDPVQIERLMRRSKLSRAKWNDNRTYLSRTIRRAILKTAETYRPLHETGEPNGTQVESDAARIISLTPTWIQLISHPPEVQPVFNLFEPGEVHVISGRSTEGKTAWTLWHAGLWCSNGRIREETAPPEGFVIYISPDARLVNLARTIHRFRTRGAHKLGCEAVDFANERFFPMCRQSDNVKRFEIYKLARKDGWKRLAELIELFREKIGSAAGTPMLVLDTLARMAGRMDELNNSNLTELVEQAEWVATQTEAVVTILHHVSQNDHYKQFKDIDPLIFGRAGTGTACAPRVNISLARVEDTGGQVLGAKLACNNRLDPGPLYWEVCPNPREGILYFDPIDQDEVSRRQESNKGADGPTRDEFFAQLRLHFPEQKCNVTQAQDVMAELSKKSKTGQPVQRSTRAFLDELREMGAVVESKGPRNSKIYEWQLQ